jgi:hypothetical protein
VNIEEKTYEQIELFLEGKMRGNELREFRHRLKVDAEFAEEVESVRELFTVINLAGDPEMEEKLEQLERRDSGEKERREIKTELTRRSWYMMYVLIGVLLIISAAALVAYMLGPGPKALFTQNFEVYPLQQSYATEEWNDFSRTYGSANYSAALLELRAIEADEEVPAFVIHFYSGMLNLAQKDAHSRVAIDHFDAVLKTPNYFHDKAQWYKALAQLEAGDVDAARITFENIAGDPEAYNYKEAQNILNHL